MKFRNQFLKYEAPATDGTEGGGSAGSESDGKGGEGQGEGSGKGSSDDKGTSEREAELLKEVMKKKGKITDLSGENEELKTKLAQFDGIDLEKYKQLTEAEAEATRRAEEAEQERLRSEGKVDELLAKRDQEHKGIVAQMRDQHTEELNTVRGESAQLAQANEALVAQIEELTVGNAFANSDFIHNKLVSAFTPERTRKLYGEHFDVENGSIVAFDKPRNADGRTKLVDKEGNSVGFEEALSRIINADPTASTLLRSESKQGSGSGSSNGRVAEQKEIGSGRARILAALSK